MLPEAVKKNAGSIATLAFALAALVAVYFVATGFREREENIRSQNPIVFCRPENVPPDEQTCLYTTHAHLYITVRIFGRERTLPFERGGLENPHTHAQKNKLHWHALVEVDPRTRKAPEDAFTLGGAFDNLGIYFATDGIFERRTGEANPNTGTPSGMTMAVNGEKNGEFGEYVWNDGDRIEIIFE